MSEDEKKRVKAQYAAKHAQKKSTISQNGETIGIMTPLSDLARQNRINQDQQSGDSQDQYRASMNTAAIKKMEVSPKSDKRYDTSQDASDSSKYGIELS